ncbi:MAG: murein biosynthesis integral membrane protein MurJ [bacterium]|nr:murein biosynthesis integral membrane protein MurJ [bacterium]
MFSRFLDKKLTGPALILAGSTFLSAVFGLWRDRLLAHIFGASRILDIYTASFRIPDLVYNFLIAGGLAVAFLPVFAEYFFQDKDQAWKATNYIFNAFALLLVVLAAILFLLAPALSDLILPGFSTQEKGIAIALSRLLLLNPILMGLASVFSGVLQYFHKFLVFGLAPLFYNLGIIFGILFLAPSFGIFGVGAGVIIGAICYFLIQLIFAVSCGFSWRPLLDFKDESLAKVFQLMVLRTVSVLSSQASVLVMTAIASIIGAGAISVFYFANNLQGFLAGLVGVSFATVVFPSLAKAASERDSENFSKDFHSGFRQVLWLSLAGSLLLFIFRDLAVKILLGGGRFSPEAQILTASAVGIFAFSIFAQAENPLLLRAFFSLKEAKKPAMISLAAMFINIALSCFLVKFLTGNNWMVSFLEKSLTGGKIANFSLLGLPLAFSISSILQFVLLTAFLKRKLKQSF